MMSFLIRDTAAATFYLTTWEEYHTGTLYLGVVSGPVEGVLMLCGIFAFTAVKGMIKPTRARFYANSSRRRRILGSPII